MLVLSSDPRFIRRVVAELNETRNVLGVDIILLRRYVGDDVKVGQAVVLHVGGGKAVEALVGPKAKALRDSIVMVGTMVIGAVGATWVSITCSPNLVLPGGGKFQDTLDGIYPHLLPMIFIIFCWYMMTKKKVNPIVMMLILVVIAFVGVLIGFFDPALSY